MARPRKNLSKAQIKELETLAAFLTTEQIADYFGIARSTFYEIMERQPEVFGRYKKGRAFAIFDVGQNLVNQAKKGNTAAAIFYMKTQAGWSEADQHEDEEPQPLSITIGVREPVTEVKVTNARS